jgi:hypothetical protein
MPGLALGGNIIEKRPEHMLDFQIWTHVGTGQQMGFIGKGANTTSASPNIKARISSYVGEHRKNIKICTGHSLLSVLNGSSTISNPSIALS